MDANMKAAKNKQPVVISYLRFSRPEQLKGDSIRRQLMLGEEWAKKHKLKIADTFRDQGVSAFRGKNAAEGNLSRLLTLVDTGRIPPGSVLLIEQLDRLSRNALLEALELFLSIIRRGIKIVTLMDGQEYDKESLNRGMQQLMYSLMQMSLAHEESAKKSERLSHAWVAKRRNIGGKVLTRQIPAWLKVEGNKIVINQEKAAVVRRIVRLALDGHGLNTITKRINAEFEGIGRVNYINRSYTAKILNTRALFGEFQPHKITYVNGRRKRVPIGEPVTGYYPAIITEDQFYAVQRQLRSRHRTGGRQHCFTNLLLGILYDAVDGSRMQIQDKGGGRRYVSSAAIIGRKDAAPFVAFPVRVLESTILLQLHDLIIPHLSKGGDDDARVEADALEARVDEVERKINETQAAMLADDGVKVGAVVSLLTKLDSQRKRLIEQLREMRQDLAARSTSDLNVAHQRLADFVRFWKRPDFELSEDDRVELRSIIRQVIERIDLKADRKGRDYSAICMIKLRDGTSYDFWLHAAHVNTMKRNAKGHPMKTAGKKLPFWKIGIGDARWYAVGSSDRTSVRVSNAKKGGWVDVTL